MNCSECERSIASEVRTGGVEEHLHRCAACRAFAEDIQANRYALASLIVHQAWLDAVRGHVRDRIESRRRRWRSWIWPVAALASAAMLLALTFLPQFRNPAPPQPMEFAKTPNLVAWTTKPVARTIGKREPLVVKMLTNDPDVIIVWLVDQKGDAL